MFDCLVGYMYENLPDFGDILMVDGKAVQCAQSPAIGEAMEGLQAGMPEMFHCCMNESREKCCFEVQKGHSDINSQNRILQLRSRNDMMKYNSISEQQHKSGERV